MYKPANWDGRMKHMTSVGHRPWETSCRSPWLNCAVCGPWDYSALRFFWLHYKKSTLLGGIYIILLILKAIRMYTYIVRNSSIWCQSKRTTKQRILDMYLGRTIGATRLSLSPSLTFCIENTDRNHVATEILLHMGPGKTTLCERIVTNWQKLTTNKIK